MLGVCSWSLRPTSAQDLCEQLSRAGLFAVQLALDPLRTGWGLERTAALLGDRNIRILSGMMAMQGEDYSSLESIRRTGGVRPDSTWDANLRAAEENAALARRLGLSLVTFHAGFLPHNTADPERRTMIERLLMLRDVFAAEGIAIALETGQESAATLLDTLGALDGVGINFDPANMILYGMGDPVEALRQLAPRVRQIHIKDAVPPATPGVWGTETPVGRGSVDWQAFFGIIRAQGLERCDLIIERESGESRTEDVRHAAEFVQRHIGDARA